MTRDSIRRKKLLGAVLSALVMGGLLLALGVGMLAGHFLPGQNHAEDAVVILCALSALVMAAAIGAALFQRWKEIQGGEEDEARKY